MVVGGRNSAPPAIQNRSVLMLMQDGVPHRLLGFRETEYYRERAEAEQSSRYT
jgi:hypothetical protein